MLKRRLKEPFGKAGLTVAILALVFALVGGAYAAGGFTKSQEKQITKIAKKYAGQDGAPGATGPAGTNGTNGKDGVPGAKGDTGTAGTNGKNVVTTNITTAGLEGHCATVGGTRLQVEGSAAKEYVCNGGEGPEGPEGLQGLEGHTGPTGQEGSPWTAGGTLPPSKTETGTWSATGTPIPTYIFHLLFAPISFTIPLSSASVAHTEAFVATGATGEGNLQAGSTEVTGIHTQSGFFTPGQPISGGSIPAGTTITSVGFGELEISAAPTATESSAALTATRPPGCTAGTVTEPKASAGNLCVFSSGLNAPVQSIKVTPTGELVDGIGLGMAGTVLAVNLENEAPAHIAGTWAVTAP